MENLRSTLDVLSAQQLILLIPLLSLQHSQVVALFPPILHYFLLGLEVEVGLLITHPSFILSLNHILPDCTLLVAVIYIS